MTPLILTTGEPAGIGPDICIQLSDYLAEQDVVLCGDIELLRARARLHNSSVEFYHHGKEQPLHSNGALAVHHTPCPHTAKPGILNVANASYVLETLNIAAHGTLSGQYAGIVTAPIHKGIICENGAHFSGHTEYFAEQTRAPLPVMVLGTTELKVGLVTTHIPLHKVSETITPKLLSDIISIINTDMKRYFVTDRAPQIGVCGINPHAGEDGHLGREELDIINPTLNALRSKGIEVSQALPADTLFVPHHANCYDIIVAMYHDQGLPVVKAQGFGACVNMTFGLPIIRTSVDHGTALDLAGTDRADASSLRCAVEMAKNMVAQQREAHTAPH